jgi:hypothetical protein
MIKKRWEWWPRENVVVVVKLSNELWYDTKHSGERIVYLFRLGWYERDEMPGIRIYSLALLWLSVQIGF